MALPEINENGIGLGENSEFSEDSETSENVFPLQVFHLALGSVRAFDNTLEIPSTPWPGHEKNLCMC